MSAAAVTVAAPAWHRTLAALVGRGLRDQRRAPLVWGGSRGAMSALVVAIWPSIEGSVGDLLSSYPEGLREAFGIDTLDSVEAYRDAEMLSLVVPLALAFFAVRSMSRATVTAEEQGHLDTLLALPVSRVVLVAGAFAVTGILLVGILAVVWAVTWLAGAAAGAGLDAGRLAVGLADVWPLAMTFAGLTALAAGTLRRSPQVLGVAIGTLIAMYVVDLVGRMSADVEPLREVSAFRYYGGAIQHGLDISHIAVLVIAAAVLAAAGAALFARRDVR